MHARTQSQGHVHEHQFIFAELSVFVQTGQTLVRLWWRKRVKQALRLRVWRAVHESSLQCVCPPVCVKKVKKKRESY